MLTPTPGWGPGKRRRRAGTRTRAYIKNNNKNLLALQTAQPVPGDRLAWHFQTSWTCPNSSQTWAPSHARRCSPQQRSTACILEPPPLQNTTVNPLNPTILPHFKQKYALFPCFSRRGVFPP